ncbi:calcium-binding protein [Streptomyces odontomachi]|uniref:calcium-binding protein n=1 Tax=Streptomyces odontomachi TaxID=2944940 RepID=UPI002109720E|nr:calcium-binding protein [Streptomyces sp. ODS25]
MRIRTLVAAATMSGALALTAFAVPAAQASPTALMAREVPPGGPGAAAAAKPDAASRFGAALAQQAPRATARAATTDPVVESVAVHGGADIVLGTTDKKTIKVAVTATHPKGIYDAELYLWHGTDVDNDIDGAIVPNESAATCTAIDTTTSKCVLSMTIDPRADLYTNALAGTWHVGVGVVSKDGYLFWDDYYTTHHVQRLSKQTVNASPEPVKKGATITVTGKLSRANWEDHKYHGYTGQSVQLQFRPKSSSTYSTVKTLTTNSTGELKTTVKAAADGYWRYSFAGTSTTPAVKAAGDFVDVQ